MNLIHGECLEEMAKLEAENARLKLELLGLDGQICEAAGSVLGDRNDAYFRTAKDRIDKVLCH